MGTEEAGLAADCDAAAVGVGAAAGSVAAAIAGAAGSAGLDSAMGGASTGICGATGSSTRGAGTAALSRCSSVGLASPKVTACFDVRIKNHTARAGIMAVTAQNTTSFRLERVLVAKMGKAGAGTDSVDGGTGCATAETKVADVAATASIFAADAVRSGTELAMAAGNSMALAKIAGDGGGTSAGATCLRAEDVDSSVAGVLGRVAGIPLSGVKARGAGLGRTGTSPFSAALLGREAVLGRAGCEALLGCSSGA